RGIDRARPFLETLHGNALAARRAGTVASLEKARGLVPLLAGWQFAAQPGCERFGFLRGHAHGRQPTALVSEPPGGGFHHIGLGTTEMIEEIVPDFALHCVKRGRIAGLLLRDHDENNRRTLWALENDPLVKGALFPIGLEAVALRLEPRGQEEGRLNL